MPLLPTILAFDIGGTRIKAALVHGACVRSLTTVPTTGWGVEELMATLVHLGDQVRDGRDVAGIGLCIKGIVDPTHGTLVDVNETMADWIGQPLAAILAEQMGRPCVMENDARMYTLGEFLHGSGRGSENMVCLTLGTGVGSGVAIGGQVLRGPRGTAGILGGHLTVQADGPLCTCGNIGCLEALIGTAGLLRSVEEMLAAGRSSVLRGGALDPKCIFAAAAAGDLVAQHVVQRFATDLSAGVVTMIHAYDPDIVVLGGGMMGASAQFLPAVQAYADAHAWTIPRGRVRVVPAALGDAAALVGVAALVNSSGVLQ